jgi:hypothetical protein
VHVELFVEELSIDLIPMLVQNQNQLKLLLYGATSRDIGVTVKIMMEHTLYLQLEMSLKIICSMMISILTMNNNKGREIFTLGSLL